jgi:hypothetical protein
MDRFDPRFPHVSYSLDEFVAAAKRLEGTALHKFALNGIAPNNHLVVVDPIKNAINQLPLGMKASRDYDSLIGVDANIILEDNLYVYPLPRHADVLTENVHVDICLRGDEVIFHLILKSTD